ncbi:MAG: DNA gyrase subunit A [Thermoflexales bacterium]|nr:DNA gyrase subunit A [Thermoflexales bacterium]MDW8351764.1 DNA gyrase subunit A [Anaerolineae bacterium]
MSETSAEVIEPASTLGRIRDTDIDREMRSAYLDYAMSVIVSRALPDARDGLKPVQRRILYVMYDTGARASAPYRKSARVVGDVLGKYHPHGDSSVYEALARMAQDFSIRYTLIDGQGNFGSIDGDPPAAMRYTEARLSRIAEELLADLDKDTVDWMDNFDGTLQEPSVLPSALPNLLLNGAAGIAVGMATNIPPHNLNELCRAIGYLVDHWERLDDVSVEDLMQIVPGPDFPTGGLIIGREGIAAAYATGHGRLVMRGVASIEEMRGGRHQIIITELPYQVNKAALIERIAELVHDGRIEEISDIRDESDRRGMRIVIELRRGAQPTRVLNRLYKYTALQSTFGVQTLALVADENGRLQPRLLSLKRALVIFIEHRRQVIRRRSEFDLAKTKARAHVLEGLRVALNFLDEVIRIIRNAPDAEAAKAELVARLTLTEVQAQAILDMQLRRLAALERQKIEDEYQECLRTIAYLEDLLAHPAKILALIKEDSLKLAEKYGDARRTRIVLDVREDFDDEELIPDKSVLVSLTEKGYIKRTPIEAYRAQNRGGRGVSGMTTKEEDEVIFLFNARTHDTVLFFTDRGKVYALQAHQIPEADRAAKGVYLANLIALGERERVTAALPISRQLMALVKSSRADEEEDDETNGNGEGTPLMDVSDADDGAHAGSGGQEDGTAPVSPPANGQASPTIAMCTRMGKIKRVDLSAFVNIRSSGLICMTLAEGDELSYVRLTPGNGELMLVTAQGQALRFSETLVRRMGRTAGGVRAMRFKKPGDYIAGMEVVEPGGYLLTVTERGYGKCTTLDEYSAKGRGGSGMRTMSGALDVTGELVAARVVQPEDQITIISAGGVVLRQRVSDIPKTGRATRGSRLINLREGDSVASVARLARVD